jgi:16S rRNA G966 N2-methylase RsmD
MDKIFNNPDLYPTPNDVIFSMLEGTEINNKTILEPSAGKGNIIDYLNQNGAKEVLFCESNEDLAHISSQKARFLQSDFLSLESSEVSHIDLIVMNPPFSADEKHILHAYNIAPAGCTIISLANLQTVENTFSASRKELKTLIDTFGSFKNLGNCFENSERQTGVNIALITLQKPSNNYNQEFDGFFMEEEDEEEQENGLMSYNVVRDLVNRYIESIKIFDRQLEEAQKMNQLTKGYFSVKMGMTITDDKKPIERNTFKKEMQKSGWNFIFDKLNMQKYATRGLREDINKFVEEQTNVPFTMRNIYKMIEIVVGTTEQRMDKAILEVFDKVTIHHHENRHNVEGWKTNSHFLLNKKFIIPDISYQDQRWYKGQDKLQISYTSGGILEDLLKALCYVTGSNYDNCVSLYDVARYQDKITENGKIISGEYNYINATNKINKLRSEGREVEYLNDLPSYGTWFDWEFFTVKAHKKGTLHLEFKDVKIWEMLNQRVAKIKGYPLYEKAPDKRTERQKAKEQAQPRPTAYSPKVKPTVLKTYTLKQPVLFD